MEGFKEITDLRDTKKDSTFWIIGSDPNLDLYPDDFFDDKLSIAISVSCIAFPNSTYLLTTSNPVASVIARAHPDLLAKFILPLNYKRPRSAELDPFWGDYGLDPIYMRLAPGAKASQTDSDWKRMVAQIFGSGLVEFVQPNSSVHYGVEVAAILGAERIILVGCSHRSTRYFYHARKRGMGAFFVEKRPGGAQEYPTSYTNGKIPELASMERDTRRLKQTFAEHGVEIVRHRYDGEKGEFVFEEIEEA